MRNKAPIIFPPSLCPRDFRALPDEAPDDTPPDHGATDPDALPAPQWIEQMEIARANRVKDILRHLGESTSGIPDRLPEGFFHTTYKDGVCIFEARAKRRRGRRKKVETLHD